jgi:hypothetical protein
MDVFMGGIFDERSGARFFARGAWHDFGSSFDKLRMTWGRFTVTWGSVHGDMGAVHGDVGGGSR